MQSHRNGSLEGETSKINMTVEVVPAVRLPHSRHQNLPDMTSVDRQSDLV
jgi:hypothetical protein